MIEPERAVVVALATGSQSQEEVARDLEELTALLATAGGEVVAQLVQKRAAPDTATYIGGGKVEELRSLVGERKARVVVFDRDLTPAQVHHLEEQLPEGVKVLDRAAVILDIFAARARTREAKLQVELAQLSYLLPRLTRRWQHLSRQAGGIGTRGVGETQLEIDRRVIRRRLSTLKRELRALERERQLQRKARRCAPTVALVGYTNAGKSALFTKLTGEKTLVEDRLFATLDPLVRRAVVGDGIVVTVADTVGFIRKLPHELVASFRATLSEAASADVLIHVVDASDPRYAQNLRVGEEVLESLGLEPATSVIALNKVDLVEELPDLPSARKVVAISARTGQGLAELRQTVGHVLLERGLIQRISLPIGDGPNLSQALARAEVVGWRFTATSLELFLLRR